MTIMAIRDLIPWSRQENRLPASVSAERSRDDQPHPLLSLHRDMNRLFDNVFRGLGVPSLTAFERNLTWPNLELGETDKDIQITAELPGIEEKDLDITVEEGVLTLRGEKKAEVEDKDRGYTERSYGRFERRVGLPRGIEQDKASATFQNGVLTITLPKSEAANENVRRIPVTTQAA
jgi:HSP20 family protein